MGTLSFHGVDVGLFEGGEGLVGRLLEADAEIQDGDVLVVSSKIVSLAECRTSTSNRCPSPPAPSGSCG